MQGNQKLIVMCNNVNNNLTNLATIGCEGYIGTNIHMHPIMQSLNANYEKMIGTIIINFEEHSSRLVH